MIHRYFKLNPECYLVQGTDRSVMHNLLTSQVVWLSAEQTQLLCRYENGEHMEKNQNFFDELERQGWGFYTEKPYYIDKIWTNNELAEKLHQQDSPKVTLATLQLTDQCNRNCYYCGENYCPDCIQYGTGLEMPLEKAESILDSLKSYGLSQVVLCGGEPALYENLDELLEYARNLKLDIIIHTNGMIPMEADLTGVQIVINIDSPGQLKLVELTYAEIDHIVICLYDQMDQITLKNPTWKIIKKRFRDPDAMRQTMNQWNVVQFDLVKDRNRCLNSRIFIMNNLDVVTCLGKLNYVGNLSEDTTEEIINRLSENPWKDCKAQQPGCRECEFRYACNPCVRIHKQRHCSIV